MITLQQYTQAAAAIGCEVAAVKAVCHVESGKAGFYPGTNKIVIKFEGHVFHLYTKGKFDATHPTLSYPAWTEKYTEDGLAAYHRFNQAFALDPTAAMLSTSWGMFQIMGENYGSCGFKTVGDFVDDLKKGEALQLADFCRYIKSERIDKYLVAHNWASFAYRYNGALYKRNDYDGQLRRAFLAYQAGTMV